MVDGRLVGHVSIEGASLFLEDGIRDRRASFTLRVVLPCSADPAEMRKRLEWSLGQIEFRELTDETGNTFIHDIAETCRKKRVDVGAHLMLVESWIGGYLSQASQPLGNGDLKYQVEVSERLFANDSNELIRFVYLNEENLDVNSEFLFNEDAFTRACFEFIQAVFDADEARREHGEDYDTDTLATDVNNAFMGLSGESDDCHRFEYLFTELLADVIDWFVPEDSCRPPLFQWYASALAENPFLDATDSWCDDSIASSGASTTYWTSDSHKARECVDNMFTEDARTLTELAGRVRQSVAAGTASSWLGRADSK
jgi:hypothetical protein